MITCFIAFAIDFWCKVRPSVVGAEETLQSWHRYFVKGVFQGTFALKKSTQWHQ
nr:MAG TPA: hypothetical protein [Caudoviricetes sp.]